MACLGWLEPLLETTAKNKTIVPYPVIDGIDKTSFRYMAYPGVDYQMGVFRWNLQFTWQLQPTQEYNRRHSPGQRGNAEGIR